MICLNDANIVWRNSVFDKPGERLIYQAQVGHGKRHPLALAKRASDNVRRENSFAKPAACLNDRSPVAFNQGLPKHGNCSLLVRPEWE